MSWSGRGCWKIGVGVFLLSLLVGCASTPLGGKDVFQIEGGIAPYSHLDFKNDPDDFQFAIVSDREGGERPGVFPAAIRCLNLLRPEFVMSVGDLIPGYTQDEAALEAQWGEVEGMIDQLDMPFFYVAGNHDMGYPVMRKVWRERRRAKDYYHFIYKGVLFLVLSTEDPPTEPSRELAQSYADFKRLQKEDPAKAKETLPARRREWAKMIPPRISDAQVEYVRGVLAENPEVRWTLCFLHKPAWEEEEVYEPNFARIEELLAGRPYTFFAGHQHNYKLTRRNGRDYIRLGATGAVFHHEGAGSMDHVAWVTMTDDGPIVANLLLNGILGKGGAVEDGEFLRYRAREAGAQ